MKLYGTLHSGVSNVGSDDRFKGKDWIALLAALAVDVGVLVLTLVRPRAGGQTFMGDDSMRSEARSQLENVLGRHRAAAL